MSKKKKVKKTGKKNSRYSGFPMQNLSADRFYNSQIKKAIELGMDEDYQEVLAIIEPLTLKYPQRYEGFELLGLAYRSLDEPDKALIFSEKVLELTAKNSKPYYKGHYSYALTLLLGGLPLMAKAELSKINADELARQTYGELDSDSLKELEEFCQSALDQFRAANNLDAEAFASYQSQLEKAQYSLKKKDTTTAIDGLELLIREYPTEDAYTELASAHIMAGKTGQAIEVYRQLLTIFPDERFSYLATLTKLLQITGQRDEATSYLKELLALPRSQSLPEIITLAGALALFEDDQAVYTLIQPVYDDDEIMDNADEEMYKEALTLAVVAATHLGKREEALAWLEAEGEDEDHLVVRTWQALEAGEDGPRAGGRFFYENPLFTYTPILVKFEHLLTGANQDLEIDQLPGGRAFLDENVTALVEIFTYMSWVSEEFENKAGGLAQLLKLKEGAGVEVIKRFAFTRAGDDLLRLAAVATLQREGYLAKDATLTLWLDGQERTGTMEEVLNTLPND